MDHSRFDWDEANIGHIAEHGITPEEAEYALDNDPVDLEYQTRHHEDRLLQIGETSRGRILAIVSTPRHERIRVVTAYPAIRWQVNFYTVSRRRRLQ